VRFHDLARQRLRTHRGIAQLSNFFAVILEFVLQVLLFILGRAERLFELESLFVTLGNELLDLLFVLLGERSLKQSLSGALLDLGLKSIDFALVEILVLAQFGREAIAVGSRLLELASQVHQMSAALFQELFKILVRLQVSMETRTFGGRVL
jgi:hypothetical protein